MNEHHTFFLSHASEDKKYAHDLKQNIENQGYAVWFDQNKIRLSDNLREIIDLGLSHSLYGIVVLSHAYLAPHKTWTDYEFKHLIENHKIYIILHDMTLDALKKNHSKIYKVIETVLVTEDSRSFKNILEQLQGIIEERVGKKFFPLYKHLSAKNWQDADIETYNLIRKTRLLNFPNEDLIKLNSLWCICIALYNSGFHNPDRSVSGTLCLWLYK